MKGSQPREQPSGQDECEGSLDEAGTKPQRWGGVTRDIADVQISDQCEASCCPSDTTDQSNECDGNGSNAPIAEDRDRGEPRHDADGDIGEGADDDTAHDALHKGPRGPNSGRS